MSFGLRQKRDKTSLSFDTLADLQAYITNQGHFEGFGLLASVTNDGVNNGLYTLSRGEIDTNPNNPANLKILESGASGSTTLRSEEFNTQFETPRIFTLTTDEDNPKIYLVTLDNDLILKEGDHYSQNGKVIDFTVANLVDDSLVTIYYFEGIDVGDLANKLSASDIDTIEKLDGFNVNSQKLIYTKSNTTLGANGISWLIGGQGRIQQAQVTVSNSTQNLTLTGTLGALESFGMTLRLLITKSSANDITYNIIRAGATIRYVGSNVLKGDANSYFICEILVINTTFFVRFTPQQNLNGSDIKALYEGEANTNAFTDSEKSKLASLDTRNGAPVQDLSELTAIPEVDLSDKEKRFVEDAGSDYYYDVQAVDGDAEPDDKANPGIDPGYWIQIVNGGSETPSSVKTKYESNPDTNAFTDTEKSKLSGIEDNATADQSGSEIESLLDSSIGHTNWKEDFSIADSDIGALSSTIDWGSDDILEATVTGTINIDNITSPALGIRILKLTGGTDVTIDVVLTASENVRGSFDSGRTINILKITCLDLGTPLYIFEWFSNVVTATETSDMFPIIATVVDGTPNRVRLTFPIPTVIPSAAGWEIANIANATGVSLVIREDDYNYVFQLDGNVEYTDTSAQISYDWWLGGNFPAHSERFNLKMDTPLSINRDVLAPFTPADLGSKVPIWLSNSDFETARSTGIVLNRGSIGGSIVFDSLPGGSGARLTVTPATLSAAITISPQPYEMWAITQFTSLAGNQVLFEAEQNRMIRINGGQLKMRSTLEIAGNTDTNEHIYRAIFDGATSSMDEYTAGVPTQIISGDAGSNDIVGVTVHLFDDDARNQPMNGSVGDIVFTTGDLTAQEVSDLETYLNSI